MKSVFGDNRIADVLRFFSRTPVVMISMLASKLEVSERTVRNDIKQLNLEMKDCAAIEGSQGKYMLHIYDSEKFRAVCARLMETDEFLNSPRNRMDYIFGKLMRSTEPILTDELAYEMNVGRTTLLNDLKKLRAEIEPHHLMIIGKTSKGLVLQGWESDIRYYVLENAYTPLYQHYPLDEEIKEAVREIFSGSPFEKRVQSAFERYLTVMLDRFLTGHYIGKLSESFYNLTAQSEFAVVERLMEKVTQILHTEFPIEEKLFVLLPIVGMRTPVDIQNMQLIALDENMYLLKDKMFQQIQTEMDIQIESPEFVEEFLYHLMFMVNRLQFHVQLKNPMLDELRGKYPLAWQIARIASKVVYQTYGLTVNEDEQGYLASYFGVFLDEREQKKSRSFCVAVVTGTGRITARLVAAQLKKVLDSSVSITLFTDERITTEILRKYDVVFTTVDIPCCCERPVIRIHEIFNEQELRHKIEKTRYWNQVDVPILDNNWFVMVGLLDESRFFIFRSSETYEEAVSQMVQSLAGNGQIDEGFLERLRSRERRGTMVFDHAVAIPHSVQYAGERLVLAIGVFPEPIQYQEHEIRIIFLLGLPEQISSDDSLLIRVYDEIISITQDGDMLDKITKADCFQTLLRILYRQAGEHT